jgi:cyclic-di-AMP phosphodiesterase PgpH
MQKKTEIEYDNIFNDEEKNKEKENDIDEIKPEDVKKAQDFIESKFNQSKFSKSIKELGMSIGFTQVKANVVYDDAKTQELRNQALNEVDSIMIKKDQLIVKEGEPVTSSQIEVLRNLHKLDENDNSNWYVYLSISLLIIITMLIQWIYLYKYHRQVILNTKTIILISLVNCIVLVLARTISIITPYLIPLACTPMLLSLLVDDDVSIVISIVNVILISAVVQFNIPITILALVNAVIGVIMLKNMDQRSNILYSSLFIAIVNGVLALILSILQHSNNFVVIFTNAGLAFLASILSGVLTIGFLPFFESIFDIVTTIKLLELSNPNQPLLKKLLIEAPGTYHHSVLVANLAELGAEAVGANSVLARVSAYYHDVGKLKRPYFFKENQRGDNPHDKITPNLSTLIIISHVKDGIELAKEYKIPKVIQDIIQQHHGTSLVKYFYITMKNNSEKPDEVKKEDFMYIGPTPMSKEAGIIMLADGVEAAVRSINEPTKGKIEEMVNNIIKSRLNEGQLDECDLTLKDLEKIRKAFLKGLSGIYHERIEYPKLTDKI